MREPSSRGFSMIELAVVLGIIAIAAAVAIPGYMRFRSRSQQAEVKVGLKLAFEAEKAYFAAHDQYTSLGALAFDPGPGARYAYKGSLDCSEGTWIKPGGAPSSGYGCVSQDTSRFGAGSFAPSVLAPLGRQGVKPFESFALVGLANIDNDERIDEWFISTGTSTFSNGGAGGCAPEVTSVEGGQVAAIRNDTQCD